ncbi:hypothetical protein [Rhodococcus marinonascens]|uniref:hypothetical protein n=1 Tax=Rhodococcus marinonascens TaxID=38311 RepID=UPI0009333A48|nr:hypothetical protein [Rhodococcus marinonascens]
MNEIPNPLPDTAMIVDDNGAPLAVINIDQMQADSIALAYDMARNCHDVNALDQVSAKWLDKVGAEGFGYVAAGALRTLTHHILDPTLQVLEEIAPTIPLRSQLDDAHRNATKSEH